MKQKFLRIVARKANFSFNEALALRGSTVYENIRSGEWLVA